MKQIKLLLAAFALVVTSVVAAAPAVAQGTKIIVVDQARVLRESKAGKDIASKIETIEGQMKRELEPTANSLESLGKSIEAKTANMTPEAMRADENLKSEARNFRTKLADLSKERDKRATELALTERKASIAFSQALGPVLEQIMQEEGADIMMSASDVMIAMGGTDVTDKVIAKLDASTPSIAVTRERLPAQTSQQ
jgi:outer membrane protein